MHYKLTLDVLFSFGKSIDTFHAKSIAYVINEEKIQRLILDCAIRGNSPWETLNPNRFLDIIKKSKKKKYFFRDLTCDYKVNHQI